jgi:pseudaminic acid cytidylyltransferase
MTTDKTRKLPEKPLCVCVIPAREGSKRIPLKNIRRFAGKPMIWHSIAAARRSGLFDHIFVSTESTKIAAIAREGGAEVPFIRPVQLADDYTPIYDVLLHALQWMRGKNMNIQYLCCIYATAPFIENEYLEQGYDIVSNGKANRAFTVTTFPSSIFRALNLNERGLLEMIWPEHTLSRTQDLPQAYYNAGQFHWYHVDYFDECQDATKDGAIPIVIPRYLALDIDTMEDWQNAEIIFNCLFNDRVKK